MTITANSYFAGAGLMDLGLSKAGIEIKTAFELDADAVATYRANFTHEVRQCDLSKKLVADEQDCHVKVFTYPCTRYSPISDIHAARTGDELYLHALRHMVIKPPEVFVAENVPGMRKFPVVMEAMTRLPSYFVTVFCPVESSIWLPQKRDRLIIIGSRKSFQWRPPSPQNRITLAGILEPDPSPHYPEYVSRRIKGRYRDRPIISDPQRGDIAPTCVAHYAKDVSTRLVTDSRFPNGVRPYTVREYARLQGVPDWFKFCGTDAHAYRMIGNGVSVPVAEWIGGEVIRYFRRAA